MPGVPWPAYETDVAWCDGRSKNIFEVTSLSIDNLQKFMQNLELSDTAAADRKADFKRDPCACELPCGCRIKLSDPARGTASLSGGEAQRIRLATQIGSGLVGVAYILDEPSIGLHQRDNDKLLATLKHLRDLGNSLIVVEHDEDTMRAADCIVDIGPGAGEHGGELVAIGTAEDMMKNENSITGAYLSGEHENSGAVRAEKTDGLADGESRSKK